MYKNMIFNSFFVALEIHDTYKTKDTGKLFCIDEKSSSIIAFLYA